MSRRSREIEELEGRLLDQRDKLLNSMTALRARLQPSEVVGNGIDHLTVLARGGIEKGTDLALDLVENLLDGGQTLLRERKKELAVGAVAIVGAAAGIHYLTRKKTVPIYEAYKMEDPTTLGDHVKSTWGKTAAGAERLGRKAGEAYGFASAAARDATDAMAERTKDVRAKLHDATGDVRSYHEENPAATIVAGLALGAVAAILLPKKGREPDAA